MGRGGIKLDDQRPLVPMGGRLENEPAVLPKDAPAASGGNVTGASAVERVGAVADDVHKLRDLPAGKVGVDPGQVDDKLRVVRLPEDEGALPLDVEQLVAQSNERKAGGTAGDVDIVNRAGPRQGAWGTTPTPPRAAPPPPPLAETPGKTGGEVDEEGWQTIGRKKRLPTPTPDEAARTSMPPASGEAVKPTLPPRGQHQETETKDAGAPSTGAERKAQAGGPSYEREVKHLRAAFRTNKTLPEEWRMEQLRALKKGITDMMEQINQALWEDLGKSEFETYLNEISPALHELDYFESNLNALMQREVVLTSLVQMPSMGYVMAQPYGVVFLASPWNYPFQLALVPLIGAIAAGACVVVHVRRPGCTTTNGGEWRRA